MSFVGLFIVVSIVVGVICFIAIIMAKGLGAYDRSSPRKDDIIEELENKSKDSTVEEYNKKLNQLGYNKTFKRSKSFSDIFLNDFIKIKSGYPYLLDAFREDNIIVCGVYTSKYIFNDARYGVSYSDYNFVDVYKLPIDSIEYYATSTSVSYINKVYNEGKNISLSGAIVGGMIAGDAGAIIGAGKDKNQLVNQTERKVDYEGCVVLNIDGKITKYNLSQKLASKLDNLCPEKNLEYIQAHQNVLSASSSSSKEKLKELKEMFDEGLISEEDYNNKKNEILNNM